MTFTVQTEETDSETESSENSVRKTLFLSLTKFIFHVFVLLLIFDLTLFRFCFIIETLPCVYSSIFVFSPPGYLMNSFILCVSSAHMKVSDFT